MLQVVLDFLLIPALVTMALAAVPSGLLLLALALLMRKSNAMGRSMIEQGATQSGSKEEGGASFPGLENSQSASVLTRAILTFLLFQALSSVAIVAPQSIAVLKSMPWVQGLAWPAVGLAWLLAVGVLLRARYHMLWTAALIGVVYYLLNSHITEAMLFE